MLNQKQAHLQFAQAKTQTKIAKELAMPTQTKLFKKKNPYASKKNKYTDTLPDTHSKQ